MLKAQKGGGSKHLKNAVEQNTDAIALLGHASRELPQHRCNAIRPSLNPTIVGLCADSVPISGQLFGDNLSTSLKEVKELDKLGASVAGPSRPGAANSQDRRPAKFTLVKSQRFFFRAEELGSTGSPEKALWGQQETAVQQVQGTEEINSGSQSLEDTG